MSQEQHDLAVLIRAGTPLIVIETHEELRVVEMFQRVVAEVWRPLFKWSVTDGLERLDIDMSDASDLGGFDLGATAKKESDPTAVLRRIRAIRERGVYLLLDFQPYLKDPVNLRLIREIAQHDEGGAHTLVLISPSVELPGVISKSMARFDLSMPTTELLTDMVKEEAYAWSRQNAGQRVKVNRRSMDMLVQNLKGLTLKDASRVARNAIYHDGAITDSDLPEVMKAKFDLLNRGGILSFEYETARFSEVAGLERLKKWVEQRKIAFAAQQAMPGLDPPKGMMLLGVQGCGKSLAAKAVAGLLGVPLLRMDFGSLYNKYHGETEKNLRESLGSAEAMAPCVLWVDEIEKGISVSQSDSGTSQRVLGTLLTWMAEREQPVFLVATANDIENLPPELIRKGRMDEIFFVDLPKEAVRREIFRIHIEKRDQDATAFDLDVLARASDGFSGSEIEQAVVAALYSAHAQQQSLEQVHIETELKATVPLSVVMAERIDALRHWASTRTVPAD